MISGIDFIDWNISQRDRLQILPKLLYRDGWNPANFQPKDSISHEFINESLHCGLSVADSFDILTKKNEH